MIYFLIVISVSLIAYILIKITSSPADELKSSESQAPEYIINNRFKICSVDELINILDLNSALDLIQENLGLSQENWAKDAVPVLHRYIEFVQRLPASEYHHHAGDGGLVRHSLEVAIFALRISTGKIWPPNAKTEDIARLTCVWRYGIMICAILHDIGKIITNFKIQLFPNPYTIAQSTLWIADTGSMLETGLSYYTVDFSKNNNYAVHAELGYLFFQAIVPLHVRQWITTTDPNLLYALRNYLTCQKATKADDALHEIIKQADMASTARDLKSGSRQRFASATKIPLIELIMETLIYMVKQKGGYFTVAVKSGGNIFRIGEKVYIIAKYVPDKIREFLQKEQPDYAPPYPQENQRVFDTLMEYGAVAPSQYDEHKAIIGADVTFLNADGTMADKVSYLTFLQFKLATLYPHSDYPAEFQGGFTIVPTKPEAVKEAKPEGKEPSTGPVKEPISKIISHQKKLLNNLFPDTGTNADTVKNTPFPRPLVYIPSPATEIPENDQEYEYDTVTDPQKALLYEHGKRFLSWLTNGLADGSISINTSTSMIHFIEQGMLLITPKIFKYYAHGKFDKTNPQCPGLLAQKGFVSLNLHTRTKQSAFFTALGMKKNNEKIFLCYLISNQNLHYTIENSNRPANNIDITLKEFSQEDKNKERERGQNER